MFKSGYIAIVGRPNVGKSTFLNSILGQKIAAVSPKPQMTRHRILGIKHLPNAQLLFLDTPGIHKPHRSLNEYMMEMAKETFNDADVFLFLVEAGDVIREEDKEIFKRIREKKKPVIVAVNKCEKFPDTRLQAFSQECLRVFRPEAVLPISAVSGGGLLRVEEEILRLLPAGPSYYPDDQLTDQTERFLVSEIIREKVMELTKEEVPYSVTVLIESFEEPKDENKKITRIRASLITEKDSQKGILIGKGGSMIKKIGELSRKEIEAQIGHQVYLELFVRVEKDWSKDLKKVKELAYS